MSHNQSNLQLNYFKNDQIELKKLSNLTFLSNEHLLQFKRPPKWVRNMIRVEAGSKFIIGFGFGPETIVSFALPKFGITYFFPSKKNYSYFAGGEGMVWLWSTFWTAVNGTAGIKWKFVTLENSLSSFFYPRSRNEQQMTLGPFFHVALTPKLGVYLFDKVWLRAGPSFILYKYYSTEKWLPLERIRNGDLTFNFELVFISSTFN